MLVSVSISSLYGKLLLATRLLCREPSQSVLLLFLMVSEHICAAAVSVIQTTGANTVCHYRPRGDAIDSVAQILPVTFRSRLDDDRPWREMLAVCLLDLQDLCWVNLKLMAFLPHSLQT